jgi:hypothetical protein
MLPVIWLVAVLSEREQPLTHASNTDAIKAHAIKVLVDVFMDTSKAHLVIVLHSCAKLFQMALSMIANDASPADRIHVPTNIEHNTFVVNSRCLQP